MVGKSADGLSKLRMVVRMKIKPPCNPTYWWGVGVGLWPELNSATGWCAATMIVQRWAQWAFEVGAVGARWVEWALEVGAVGTRWALEVLERREVHGSAAITELWR